MSQIKKIEINRRGLGKTLFSNKTGGNLTNSYYMPLPSFSKPSITISPFIFTCMERNLDLYQISGTYNSLHTDINIYIKVGNIQYPATILNYRNWSILINPSILVEDISNIIEAYLEEPIQNTKIIYEYIKEDCDSEFSND